MRRCITLVMSLLVASGCRSGSTVVSEPGVGPGPSVDGQDGRELEPVPITEDRALDEAELHELWSSADAVEGLGDVVIHWQDGMGHDCAAGSDGCDLRAASQTYRLRLGEGKTDNVEITCHHQGCRQVSGTGGDPEGCDATPEGCIPNANSCTAPSCQGSSGCATPICKKTARRVD